MAGEHHGVTGLLRLVQGRWGKFVQAAVCGREVQHPPNELTGSVLAHGVLVRNKVWGRTVILQACIILISSHGHIGQQQYVLKH